MRMDDAGRVLRTAPHLRQVAHGPTGARFLVGEREHYVLRRADVCAVLAAVDGVRDVDAIVAELAAQIDPLRCVQILNQLEEKGLLLEAKADEPEPVQAFWSGLRLPSAAHAVSVIDGGVRLGDDTLGIVKSALGGAGLVLSDAAPVVVIVTDDCLSSACASAIEQVYRQQRALFLLAPQGLRPLLGPYFPAGAAQPCPFCFLTARREQQPVETFLQRGAGGAGSSVPVAAAIPASLGAASSLAAVTLKKRLAQPKAQTALQPTLWALDLADFSLGPHLVRARPQCAVCGDPTKMAKNGERPIELVPQPIVFAADGGFRSEHPAESHARLAPLVSALLGPVTHLSPMPGQHSPSHPVYSSGFFRVPPQPSELGPFDRPCAGKGITTAQAQMSALAEAIERYAGRYQGDEACRMATRAELGDAALPPDALHLFGTLPPRGRETVPPPLPHDVPIGWTVGHSLTHKTLRYLPLAYCYADTPPELGADYCRPSSNGSAAGNTLGEAILQGLFEAVERDAVAIWWYGRLRRPAVQIPSASEALFAAQCAALSGQDMSLWMLDLTHDLGLPVVVAVAVHRPTDRLWLGFGCHPSWELAISRALSEVHQVIDPQGTRKSPWDGLLASSLPYLMPDPQAQPASVWPAVDSQDLKDHVETWVKRLHQHGLEVIVVDKTRPDIPLCVAQVIVPGLRHAWPRLGPGRLYDVPWALGWLVQPLTEDALNPFPLLI